MLARASRFLAELDTNRFATCTYAQVDLASGTLRAVRAGHLDPLIRHNDGRVGQPKLRGGLPLGLATVFGDEEFPETRLDLVPGETLVLCTDGLVEQPDSDISSGLAALAGAIASGPPQAEALADHLSDRLWERWGSGDDVALLVLRRSLDPGTPKAPRIHQYIHQADPQGLSDARAAVGQALRDWGMRELADDAELLTGELLVNVLLHTEGGAVLTLEVLPEPVRRVRLSVQDRSSAWPRRRTPGEAATSGRGLLLLDALASRWGSSRAARARRCGARSARRRCRPTPLPAAGEPAGRRAREGQARCQTVVALQNSRMPWPASSRPYPERLTPPKGSAGWEAVMPLTKTPPASRSRTKKATSSWERVQTLELRPNGESLATATASSMSATG